MVIKRKPFQGVFNIIRFNWHFYLFALIAIFISILLKNLIPQPFQNLIVLGIIISTFSIAISLIASYYIYDYSKLYQFNWLVEANYKKILNINAGFDETSAILKSRYLNSDLTICDFYNPQKHTEISIKRARKAYPPDCHSFQVTTDNLPFPDDSFDYSFAILSAHEIRDEKERINFFKELNRATKTTGQIFVIEHLRDVNNFLAYTVGFLHFHSKSSWLQTFEQADLIIKQEIKTTPFITTFILEKNGNSF